MIAELEEENSKFIYVIKSNRKDILYSNPYSTKQSALRGFKKFGRYISSGNILLCNEIDCFHIEIVDNNHMVVAQSPNLGSRKRVMRLRNRIIKINIPIKDKTTDKMYSYIDKIGNKLLSKPITVEITKDIDYVASISHLNLFAYGDDLAEVLEEINEDLQDLYKDLFERNYELAKPAIEYKNILERVL